MYRPLRAVLSVPSAACTAMYRPLRALLSVPSAAAEAVKRTTRPLVLYDEMLCLDQVFHPSVPTGHYDGFDHDVISVTLQSCN
eukprot:SAG31_NODE_818_length_11820_cov_22.864431_7_plen_83_part_00